MQATKPAASVAAAGRQCLRHCGNGPGQRAGLERKRMTQAHRLCIECAVLRQLQVAAMEPRPNFVRISRSRKRAAPRSTATGKWSVSERFVCRFDAHCLPICYLPARWWFIRALWLSCSYFCPVVFDGARRQQARLLRGTRVRSGCADAPSLFSLSPLSLDDPPR